MNIIQKLTIGLLVANVVTILVAAYMLFFPVQLPIIYNEPFPVYPQEVKRGEVLTYEMYINKRKQYVAHVNKNIVCNDGNLVTLASVITNIPVGEHSIVSEVIVPTKASFGTCHIEILMEYQINPLRQVTQTMRTQDFKIIP